MALIRYNLEAPIRTALVEALTREVTRRWMMWFQGVGDRLSSEMRLDAAFNPGSLGAGAADTQSVTFDGVQPGDLVRGVTFFPMTESGVPTAGIRVSADVYATGAVAVTFLNVSSGTIDLDAGTIRIQVERVR